VIEPTRPTFDEAEPGLRLILGESPGPQSRNELRRRLALGHAWLQFHEMGVRELVDEFRRFAAERLPR
jgi:hypothetical protein